MRAPWTSLPLLLLRCASPSSPPVDAAAEPTSDLAAEAALDHAPPADVAPADVASPCAPRCVHGRSCVRGRCEDAWRAVVSAGAPSPRSRHAIVWTGTEALVWGGFADPGLLRDGGRYDPAAGRWHPLAATGAPGERMAPEIGRAHV